MDPAAAGELLALAEHLRTAAPTAVFVDLAGVTFACSTLANFVVRVRHLLPEHAAVAFVHPPAIVRTILAATGLNWVTILDEAPREPFGRSGPAGSLPEDRVPMR